MKRLFQGLRRRGPQRCYDAVVIGAGVGGLVCANLLAQGGMKVLLLEQHYMVGGYCSTFRRAGYTFDAATHFYPLLGNPQTLTAQLLRSLGVRTRWIRMDPVDTFHFPDGTSFTVPADFDVYRHRLAAAFPNAAVALDRFFAEVRQANLAGLLYYFRGRSSQSFEHFRDHTVRQVVDRYFANPKLKLLLTGESPHWGGPPERTSFIFDSMLRLSYFLGNYYPVGGSQAFADELARCFEAFGGEILMSSRAERILVENGQVRGVEVTTLRGPLRGSHRIRTSIAVSNGDLCQTLDRLLDPWEVPSSYRAAVGRLRPTQPCFLSHIGLRSVPAQDLERAQGYYWESWDSDRAGLDSLRCKIFSPTLYEPRMAPPNGQIIVVEKLLKLEAEAVSSWTDRDWADHKSAVESEILSHLEGVLPGISRKIVVQLSATARTSERFTLNQGGAMLGWEMSPDQLGEGRPGNCGPVDGLYLVGHWTRPGGGITPVMISARQVADLIFSRWPSRALQASMALSRSAVPRLKTCAGPPNHPLEKRA